MRAEHIEVLVEEPSMEVFLRFLLPNLLGNRATFEIFRFQGKNDLLSRLEERLRGYAAWLPDNWRIIVVLDRDDDDCLALKHKLEGAAAATGLSTRRTAGPNWRIVFRLAVEELEAWYFGDWEAVHLAYPRVNRRAAGKASYRISDGIIGGTWEAFERELRKAGYFAGGLRKIEAARNVAKHFCGGRCSSASYRCFADALLQAVE